jgi:hypothetical protein
VLALKQVFALALDKDIAGNIPRQQSCVRILTTGDDVRVYGDNLGVAGTVSKSDVVVGDDAAIEKPGKEEIAVLDGSEEPSILLSDVLVAREAQAVMLGPVRPADQAVLANERDAYARFLDKFNKVTWIAQLI